MEIEEDICHIVYMCICHIVYIVRPVLVHLFKKISKKPPISRPQRLSGEPGFLCLALKRRSSLAYPGVSEETEREAKLNSITQREPGLPSTPSRSKEKGIVSVSPGRGGVSRGLAGSLQSQLHQAGWVSQVTLGIKNLSAMQEIQEMWA